jgi:cytoskeletal protein CcmA (bactofilin family)
LTIHATGKVAGKIRYGKVVIEDGGQLTGDIQSGVAAAPKTGTLEKAGLPA